MSLRLVIIVGSTREGRLAPVIAKWFAAQADNHGGMTVDLADLAETPLPPTLTSEPDANVAALAARLAAADAFVIVTPEYNHSFPAPLKNAIDWFKAEWSAKPIGFVSYGGVSGGLRAVEQLRQVFAELHAVSVRTTVSFHSVWNEFGPDGAPRNSAACSRSAQSMLRQIEWWAYALRDAKEKRPYVA